MTDAGVSPKKLQSVVAGMMERQVQEMKGPPSGLIGGLWEKATGEIQKYNEAAEEHIKIKTQHDRVAMKLRHSQEEADKLTRRLRDNIFEEGETAESTAKQLEELRQVMDELEKESDELGESLTESTQALSEMNEGGGIIKNGLTALALKAGGAATAFFGFRDALEGVEGRLKLASKTVGDFGSLSVRPTVDATASYVDTLKDVTAAAWEWHGAITDSAWELAKFGINAEETRSIIGTYAEGLRLTTSNQRDLMKNTQQMTEDTGFLATLLRVNTEELANATVAASKRFGKSTQTMADELAGVYVGLDTLKDRARDTVMNFGDLTRATLEAQSSFQGYNFNLRSTANILGNVVAKAQEQGATYEMSMKAAEGLAGVITGGKAPDWAKYIAGRDMLSAARKAVADVEKAGLGKGLREELGKQFKMKPGELEGLSDIQVQLAKQFALDPTTKAGKAQIEGLENLTKNYKKYGSLSSAKMADELLRGTEQSNKKMFDMMKNMADKPEGRELLMRVWGLDEAAATAATLALHTAESVEDFTRIEREAKAGTAARKPPTVADLREQTEGFAKAVRQSEQGIVGSLGAILSALKTNPMVGGAMGLAGTATTAGVQVLQAGAGEAVGKMLAGSRGGQTVANAVGRGIGAVRGGASRLRAMTTGRGPTAGEAFGRMFGRGAPTSMRSGGTVMQAPLRSRAMDVLSKTATGMTDGLKGVGKGLSKMRGGLNKLGGPITSVVGKLGAMGGPLASLAGKAGFVGLAGAAGVAVGSLIRLIPGVDSFTEGLINSTAQLLGFKGALDDAETSQEALSNKSAGVQKAIANVTAGITSDYEKDNLARMKARVQLEGATKEDLQAYAKKIAATGKISEKEALVRLEQLQSEKVDHEKWRKLREADDKKRLETSGKTATELTKTKLDEKATDLATKTQERPQDLPPVAMPSTPKLIDLPKPSGMPESPQARREARHRAQAERRQRSRRAAQQPRTGAARVKPDGSIALNITIPRDALDQSNTQSDGYVR
jgi:hypothetical protein